MYPSPNALGKPKTNAVRSSRALCRRFGEPMSCWGSPFSGGHQALDVPVTVAREEEKGQIGGQGQAMLEMGAKSNSPPDRSGTSSATLEMPNQAEWVKLDKMAAWQPRKEELR